MTELPTPAPSSLETISPTRANDLLACSYRVAWSLDPRFRYLRRPTPESELGTVAHKMVDAVGHGLLYRAKDIASAETLLNETWTAFEVEAQNRLQEAWSPAVVPTASEWRGYHLTRARVIRRALRLFDSRRTQPAKPVQRSAKARVEQPLADTSAGLEGRPDRVEGAAGDRCVVDLKTGLEQSEASEDQRRQLLLYAHMVTVDEGAPPTRIAIEDASGRRWEERIAPGAVEGAVAQAVDARTRFNTAALAGTSEQLAEPSPTTCRFCTYRPVCGPFWRTLAVDWQQGSVAGQVTHFEGAAAGSILRLDAQSPGGDSGEWTVTAVPSHIVPTVGDSVRIVDAEASGSTNHLRWQWRTLIEPSPTGPTTTSVAEGEPVRVNSGDGAATTLPPYVKP